MLFPQPVLLCLSSFLTAKDIIHLRQTCRYLNDHMPLLGDHFIHEIYDAVEKQQFSVLQKYLQRITYAGKILTDCVLLWSNKFQLWQFYILCGRKRSLIQILDCDIEEWPIQNKRWHLLWRMIYNGRIAWFEVTWSILPKEAYEFKRSEISSFWLTMDRLLERKGDCSVSVGKSWNNKQVDELDALTKVFSIDIDMNILLEALEKDNLFAFTIALYWSNLDTDSYSQLLLVACQLKSRVAFVRIILDHGFADPNFERSHALHTSILHNQLDCTFALLELDKVDIFADSQYALQMACSGGHLALVRQLLQMGCDPLVENQMSLMLSIQRHHVRVVECLLQDGRVDPRGVPWKTACQLKNKSMIELLFNYGLSDENHTDDVLNYCMDADFVVSVVPNLPSEQMLNLMIQRRQKSCLLHVIRAQNTLILPLLYLACQFRVWDIAVLILIEYMLMLYKIILTNIKSIKVM